MQPLDQLSICCGQTNRGVAVGDGKVFVGRLDANLVGWMRPRGRKFGRRPWPRTQRTSPETTAPNTTTARSSSDLGRRIPDRGFVSAYDAESGDLLWRFYTVPGPGQYGNDTWAGDSWQWGGAPVWTTPAVDPELGLVIFSTGNAAPDLNGSTRAGDNLFAASIVAVDINTGQRKWHFQEVHHDIWDYDGPQPVLLFTLEKDGQEIPAVGHANKNGYYYILDRRTGEPLFDVTETEVPTEPSWQHPSPTQPIPATEELIPHEVTGNPGGTDATPAEFYTPQQEKPLIMQPGAESGSEWPPAAYSPRTGYIYIPAGGYEPWFYQSGPDNTDNLARRCVTNPAIPTPTTTVSLTR
ncbi:MAG: hypothetical protein R2838_05865 [Caldilineaceae bacterium]